MVTGRFALRCIVHCDKQALGQNFVKCILDNKMFVQIISVPIGKQKKPSNNNTSITLSMTSTPKT